MVWERFHNYTALCGKVGGEIQTLVLHKPEALLCLAAGDTSLGIFEELARMEREGELDLSQCWFIAMDEWLGMNEHSSGSCGDFLRKHFLSRVSLDTARVRLVDGNAPDLAAECDGIRDFIGEHGGIDYLLLGCGMNGHLALNEPGTSFHQSVHITQLDSVTQTVGQKYFEDAAELTGGITIGPREIAGARRTVLVIQSASKREILRRVMESEPDESLPASFLKTLPQAAIYYDADANPQSDNIIV